MTCLYSTTIFIASLIIASPTKAKMEPLIADLKDTAKGIDDFSYSFLLRSAITMKGSNVIVSPISVWSLMASLSEGASGITRDQIVGVLGYKTNQIRPSDVFKLVAPHILVTTNTISLETVNAIFHQDKSIHKRFSDIIQKIYRTHIREVDFSDKSTLNIINNYAENATNGRFKSIVSQSDLTDSQMIITNGIFFKGQWTKPFNPAETQRVPFYDDNKRQIGEVNMMFQRTPLAYANLDSFKAHVLELPYGKENRVSMIVVLPREGETLDNVINRFKQVPVREIFVALRQSQAEFSNDAVDVYFPRMNVVTDLLLNKILWEMGIHELFDPKYADLSQISDTKGLHMSRVIHKTQIEVTEEGISAAGLSASNRIGSRGVKFVANKPFLYFIVEKTTNAIPLGGTYVVPTLF